jgi:hypothetical protein
MISSIRREWVMDLEPELGHKGRERMHTVGLDDKLDPKAAPATVYGLRRWRCRCRHDRYRGRECRGGFPELQCCGDRTRSKFFVGSQQTFVNVLLIGTVQWGPLPRM